MKVVALDPGRTTGYAMGEISEGGKMLVVTGEHKWSGEDLLTHLKWYAPNVIICEKFDFRRSPKAQRDRVDLYPRELIGVVDIYCGSFFDEKCVAHYQSAAQAKGYYTNDKLKEDKIYKPGKPHANDAARHLLHWFTFGPGYKWNVEGYVSAV